MHRIGGIILAAGGSTRMGVPKQLLVLHDSPLVCNAVRVAREGGCDEICVVTGHAREAVEKAVAPLSPLLVHNEHWQRGMGSSIRLGLTAIQPVSAVVLLTCDQPAVNAPVIRALIDRHHQTGLPVVASSYGHTLGIPALFAHACFAELDSLVDDCGAKSIIQANPARVTSFDFPAGALDLDSPRDVIAWQSSAKPHAKLLP